MGELSVAHQAPSEQAPRVVFEISNFFAENQKPDELKIFDRYYRQENVMTQPGMGIGLSIVKTALDKLNREIEFSITERRAVFKLIV
jgi:K+-sensing histidine kinase KdpD